MPTIIPEAHGTVLHAMRLSGDAEPMAVTYGFRLTGTVDLQVQADDLHDAWGDFMAAVIPADYVLIRTEIAFVAEEGDDPLVAIAVGDRAGGGAAAPLPQNCAYLVHKRTARAGRRGRGRLYIPGVPEGQVDAKGLIAGAQVTGIQTAMNTFLGRVSVVNLGGEGNLREMVLLHSAPAADPPLTTPDEVTALQVDSVIATQRRRLR